MQQTKGATATIQLDTDRDSWEVCDPDKREDPLPMPYRLIDQVLNEAILSRIFAGVHEIQKKKKDPNYEGTVKELQSQGIVELEGISCMAREQSHRSSHIILGDRIGSIYLLDVSKKLILSKKQVVPGSRIESIACSSYQDGDVTITTIAVVVRAHPTIYVFRYRSGQSKLFLSFQINVAKKVTDPAADIGSYPFQCKFSKYALFLAVSLYDGSIQLYEIPEVTLTKPKEQRNSQESITSQPKIHPTYYATLDEPTTTIENCSGTIAFQGVEQQAQYKNLLESFKKKEQKPVEPQKKQAKKEAKKEQKKQEPKQTKPERVMNQKVSLGETFSEAGKDFTASHPTPKYMPMFYFINECMLAPRTKYFEEIKSIWLSTRLMVSWKYTKKCQIYSLQQLSQDNVPSYLYEQFYQEAKKSKRTKVDVKKIKQFSNVYEVSCLAISHDQSLLACGLKDGTIAVWDMFTDSLKFNLDKHKMEVSHLAFFEVYRLLSGSVEGEVHLDDLSTVHLVMKRTNIFQSKIPFKIINMQVSHCGVGFVLDSLGNLRMYDLWRGEKIAKLLASTAYIPPDGKIKKWFTEKPLMICDEQSLSIVSEIVIAKDPEELTAEEKETISKNSVHPWRKATQLQVFRIFENLIGLFDGLANVYRRGIDKDKVINLYSNLEFQQLTDKMFQIPRIGGSEVQDKHEENLKHHDQKDSVSKSDVFSEASSNTFKSRGVKNTTTTKIKQVGLTKQALHPQMHLFRRRETPKIVNPNENWLIESVRDSHLKKDMRQATLLRQSSKHDTLH